MRATVLGSLAAAILGLLGAAPAGAQTSTDEGQCVPDASCVSGCFEVWSQVVHECIAAGHPRTACADRGRTAWYLCIHERCEPGPDCEERCAWRARRLFWRCIEAGHTREVCQEHSAEALRMCVERHCEPCACPRIYAPVCGADGMTYPNACEARCAGVPVAHEGMCREAMCRTNEDCAEGEVCHPIKHECMPECSLNCLVPNPVCGVDGNTYFCGPEDAYCHGVAVAYPGACREPCFCPQIYDPVCGVDGMTYSNACEARCAGVEIAHEGECRKRCENNTDCDDPNICYPPSGMCQPVCEIQCIRYDPVCGSDGVTYACGEQDAWCHGARVVHRGECERCDNGCPEIYAPVCGSDGVTYANPCEAGCAGVEIAYEGPCRCYGDQDCPDGLHCNAEEACLPPPGCDATADPACPAVCTGVCVR